MVAFRLLMIDLAIKLLSEKFKVTRQQVCFSAHKTAVAMAAIYKFGFHFSEHPPYQHDLTPSEYSKNLCKTATKK